MLPKTYDNESEWRHVKITVKKIAHHRNGVGGAPFSIVQFENHEDGGSDNMVGIVFDEPAHCAVFDANLLGQGVIEFIENSWRGDVFEPLLRRATNEYYHEQIFQARSDANPPEFD